MSVNLTTAPPAFAFSADLITAKFSCVGYLEQIGVYAKNTINLAALQAFAPNQTLIITYHGVSITMIAQASPDDSGNSFKANAGTPAEVAQGFQSNFRLNTDFTISVAGSTLTLIARKKSDQYNFTAGGINTVIGKNDVLKPNYGLSVRLFCQNADHSDYDLINESILSINLNNNGLVDYPVADKLHNYISSDVRRLSPDIPEGNAILCKRSFRKYYVEFSERYGEVDIVERKLNTSPSYTILHGGLSHKAQFQHSLQSLIAPGARNLDRFLKQGNNQVYTRTNQPQFLYFFNTRANVANAVLKVKIYYKDNATETKDLYSIAVQQYQKVAFDLTFDRIGANAAKVVEKYEVWLASGSTVISETRTYHLNYQLRSYVRYFLNWSSWGSLDSRLCYGKGNTEFELIQSMANRVLKPGFDIKQGKNVVFDVSIKSNFSVATGWMSRSELLLNRDFYLSPIKYRYVGGLMMPIAIPSTKINELEDGNHLYSQSFEYRYLYDDHAYTEGDVEEPGLGFGDFFFSSNPVGGNPGGVNETDPTVPIWVKQITQQDITRWNSANHVHGNFALLEALSYESGYLFVGGLKIKAGFADNAKHWNDLLQTDYLTQPVRPGDDPKFKGTGSPAFQSGFSGSGWQIQRRENGVHATFDYLTVRKEMNVYELIVNQIRATNGSVWVSDGIKILDVEILGNEYHCTIDTDENRIGVPFRFDDILRCQRWTGRNIKYYVARVTSVDNGSFTLVKIDGGGIPEPGDDVVRMGNRSDVNRQGALYLTASDDGAPYIDILDGVDSASLEGKTKARIGKLSGITDPDFGELEGYGIYTNNGYFKGILWVIGGNAETIDGAQAKVNAAKAAIELELSDVSSALNNLDTYVDGAFKDGVISSAEAKAIEKYINSINTEKADVDKKYDTVYANASLTGTPKTNLASAKTAWNTSHTNLINSINTAIAGGTTTPAQKNDVDSKFSLYRNALVLLTQRFEEAINAIATAKADGALNASKTYTNTEISAVNGKINLKADQLTVNAMGDRVSANEAAIVLIPDQITIGVQGEVNRMQIGGRNLLRNSTFNQGDDHWSISQGYRTILPPESDKPNSNILRLTFNTSTLQQSPYYNTSRIYIDGSSTRYTVSFDFYCADLNAWDASTLATIRTSTASVGGTIVSILTFTKTMLINRGLISGQWFRFSFSFDSPAKGLWLIFGVYINGTVGEYMYRDIKVERGDKATDWSPAPEDIDAEFAAVRSESAASIVVLDNSINSKVATTTFNALGVRVSAAESEISQIPSQINLSVASGVNGIEVGGSNILKDTNRRIQNSAYAIADYEIIGTPSVGDRYTITIWGLLAANKSSFRAYNSGGNRSLATLVLVAPNKHSATFTWTSDAGNPVDGTFVRIYCFNSAESGTSRIDRIKLERGTKATDWSPAPEDVEASINLKVSAGDIASSINQTAQAVKINASKIELNGAVTFNSFVAGDKSQIEGAITKANAAETPSGAQAKATAALNAATQAMDINTIAVGSKRFNNVAGYTGGAGTTGMAVITTPILSSFMTRVKIIGYNYVGGSSDIDLTVNFYAYAADQIVNYDYTSVGNFNITKVRVYRNAENQAVIILQDIGQTWQHPKLQVEYALISYNTPPDSYKNGWSINIVNSLPAGLKAGVTLSGMSIQQATEAAQLRADKGVTDALAARSVADTIKVFTDAVRYANTTEIDGGSIRTGTITALGAVVAGSFNLGNGKFKVTSAGILTAEGAIISGTITATAGKVGGWDITASGIKSGSGSTIIELNPGNIFLRSNGVPIPTGYGNFSYDSVAAFQVITPKTLSTALFLNGGTLAGGVKGTALIAYGDVAIFEKSNFALGDDVTVIVGTSVGSTFVQPIGGGWGLKFVKGICVGAVAI